MTLPRAGGTIGAILLLCGCATHRASPPPGPGAPVRWSNAGTVATPSGETDALWWRRLGDPVTDRLIATALADNPTLAEALARVDQARAGLAAGRAGQLPRLEVTGAASRGEQNLGSLGGASAIEATTGSISPRLSWEVDLWSRVRQATRAAESRLDARTADARAARLSVTAQIASGVLRLRACNYSLAVRAADIASRTTELDLMRARLSFGNVAPVEVSTARSNLATAETDRISQREVCAREVDALVALTGVGAATIHALLPEAPAAQVAEVGAVIPPAPPMRPVLPATVLLRHPAVVAAEREAAARWSEIGVAQAERLPRVDLTAVLTGQWIRALGSTSDVTTWSVGPQLSGTIFDAGAGAANVRNAEARYREAAAALERAVRTAVQSIEDGLAAQQSAEQRMATSREALDAARFALRANEARRRVGAISQFELEESRRQFNRAQESAIAAARDHAAAWVELVRTSGNGFDLAAPPTATASITFPSLFAKP